MITGYNTDVRHGSRTFHVQTEDKGLANPKIETLIYVGGEILDSYRSSYEDLQAASTLIEPAVQTRMDEQHRAVIRDIKNGKYDVTPSDTLELVLDRPLAPAFGQPFRVQIQARLCHTRNPVPDAEIAVKLVSSLRKATGLLTGRTDAAGCFVGEINLPPSQPGQCAVVVSCTSDRGFDELKALVTSG